MSKEFTIDGNRFDLSNYHGRLQHFLHMVDPRALLLSDANVREAQSYIAKFRETGTMTGSNENMWAYQNLINSAVHPATGDLIPKLCRVSAIAPINIPIVYAMMMVPPTNVAGTLVMHIANQSYNAACNYFNRSGAAAPLEAMATAYGLAVSSACAIAYSMGKAVSKFPVLQRFSIMIPILSTCAASSSNLAFTRADELKEGADVYDEQGNCYGKSIVAGKQGIIQTALSRCVLVPFAVVMFPTACTKLLEK